MFVCRLEQLSRSSKAENYRSLHSGGLARLPQDRSAFNSRAKLRVLLSQNVQLYAVTTSQPTTHERTRAMHDRTGNLPPLPGVFPDYGAPIMREAAAGREMVIARWGMPSPMFARTGVHAQRNEGRRWRRTDGDVGVQATLRVRYPIRVNLLELWHFRALIVSTALQIAADYACLGPLSAFYRADRAHFVAWSRAERLPPRFAADSRDISYLDGRDA